MLNSYHNNVPCIGWEKSILRLYDLTQTHGEAILVNKYGSSPNEGWKPVSAPCAVMKIIYIYWPSDSAVPNSYNIQWQSCQLHYYTRPSTFTQLMQELWHITHWSMLAWVSALANAQMSSLFLHNKSGSEQINTEVWKISPHKHFTISCYLMLPESTASFMHSRILQNRQQYELNH